MGTEQRTNSKRRSPAQWAAAFVLAASLALGVMVVHASVDTMASTPAELPALAGGSQGDGCG